MVPLVGWCTPASTFTRVDLPAPLSPTRATTSPAWTSRSMSVSAETAPNCLLMPRRLSTVSPVGGGAACVIICHVGAFRIGRTGIGWDRPREAGRSRSGWRQGVMPSFLQPSA